MFAKVEGGVVRENGVEGLVEPKFGIGFEEGVVEGDFLGMVMIEGKESDPTFDEVTSA